MNPLLTKHYTNPLEREFEAWIINQIEAYFKNINTVIDVWAVSPKFEVTWPADEVMVTGGKLIGLQFKQAKLGSGSVPNLNRLKWELGSPKGQFELIQKNREIFYVLPTFINRNWREQSLHHCFFWRPKELVNYNVWFDNTHPRIKTPYNQLSLDTSAYRWGDFVEYLFNCNLVDRIDKPVKLKDQLSRIFKTYSIDSNNQNQEDEEITGEIYYFIHIRM